MVADWLFVASTVFLGVSLSVLAYAVWQRTRAGTKMDGERAVTDDTVECPTCGTANESGYRYRQACLDELPGSGPSVPDSISTGNRQMP